MDWLLFTNNFDFGVCLKFLRICGVFEQLKLCFSDESLSTPQIPTVLCVCLSVMNSLSESNKNSLIFTRISRIMIGNFILLEPAIVVKYAQGWQRRTPIGLY